jgi:hypothetical protein
MAKMDGPERDGETGLRSEHAKLVFVRQRLLGHMQARNANLRVSELTMLDRVARQQITLLNPMTRKLHVEFMALMTTTMQLECKMCRRGMFYLNSRLRTLDARLADVARRAEALGIELQPPTQACSEPSETPAA